MGTEPDERQSLSVLSEGECLALLQSANVGRVAVSRAMGAPLVVPVNFVLDGRVIVFRTAVGTKLFSLRTSPISFQVDQIDRFRRTGWSVLVEGFAYEATHWEVDHLDLEPWPAGAKEHWVRLVPSQITGRILPPPVAEFDARGYR
jgi:uncharacterized protein